MTWRFVSQIVAWPAHSERGAYLSAGEATDGDNHFGNEGRSRGTFGFTTRIASKGSWLSQRELGDGGDLGVENKFCHPRFPRRMLILSATKKFTKAGPKFLRPKHWQSSSFSIDDAEYDLAVARPPNPRNCVDFAQGRFENGRQQEHPDER